MEHTNCTLYRTSEFFGNAVAQECKWVRTEIVKYAQYPRAIKVSYLEKGKRKARAFIASYQPRVVIVAGHGHDAPPDPTKDEGNGTRSLLAFDPDHDVAADAFFATLPIVEDFRGFKTTEVA